MLRTGVGVQGTAYVEEPQLVYVQPGVWVIADHSESIFYSDNYYWSYRSGYWYRSSVYTGGWVRVYSVPGHVRGIHNPHHYRHYRAPANARTRPAPAVRDHRRGSPAASPPPRSNTRVPAQRGTRAPAYRSPPPARKAPPAKKAPPPKKDSKSKSKSRDHR